MYMGSNESLEQAKADLNRALHFDAYGEEISKSKDKEKEYLRLSSLKALKNITKL